MGPKQQLQRRGLIWSIFLYKSKTFTLGEDCELYSLALCFYNIRSFYYNLVLIEFPNYFPDVLSSSWIWYSWKRGNEIKNEVRDSQKVTFYYSLGSFFMLLVQYTLSIKGRKFKFISQNPLVFSLMGETFIVYLTSCPKMLRFTMKISLNKCRYLSI